MPRAIQIERGSLTAAVFSTSGGMGRECDKLVRQIAMKLRQKRGEKYCDVVEFVRRRIQHDLIRTMNYSNKNVCQRVQEEHSPSIQ